MIMANGKWQMVGSRWLCFFLLSFCLLLIAHPALAQRVIDGYTLSVGLPEIGDVKPGESLGTLLTYIFNLSLILAAILAFGGLFYGGLMYMLSGGNLGATSHAREVVMGALSGIIILLSSWLILYTINPKLVNVKLPELPALPPPGPPINTFGTVPLDGVCKGASSRADENCERGVCLINHLSLTSCKQAIGGETGRCAPSCPAKIPHGGVCRLSAECAERFDLCLVPSRSCAQVMHNEEGVCLRPQGSNQCN